MIYINAEITSHFQPLIKEIFQILFPMRTAEVESQLTSANKETTTPPK